MQSRNRQCPLVLLFFCLSFYVVTDVAFAQTDIPAGNVGGLWTSAGSPYQIQGDIVIPDGETLTIEPGATVVFTGLYQMKVRGRLVAVGTERDSIVFTAADDQAGWAGLRFNHTPATNDSTLLVYCIFQYGVAATSANKYGGAIFIESFNKIRISHCLITQNRTYSEDFFSGGGGLAISFSSPIVENSTFSHNKAEGESEGLGCVGGHGGALYISGTSHAIIRNNLFIDNEAVGGGAMAFDGSTITLVNNTITRNRATNHAGAICGFRGWATFVNTIVYGNLADIGSQVNYNPGTPVNFISCDVQGGTHEITKERLYGKKFDGTYSNNLDADPLFVNPAQDDLRLMDNSPCIGAGVDSVVVDGTTYYAPASDCTGRSKPYPIGSRPDIGAYEHPLGQPLVDIERIRTDSPSSIVLFQNFPNPFGKETTITFFLPERTQVQLDVYDPLGRRVLRLLEAVLSTGEHSVKMESHSLAPGIYYYRLTAGPRFSSVKALLVR